MEKAGLILFAATLPVHVLTVRGPLLHVLQVQCILRLYTSMLGDTMMTVAAWILQLAKRWTLHVLYCGIIDMRQLLCPCKFLVDNGF